ncbi:MAG: hypothetical protein LBR58_05875 [Propionibacteriaceae bacterium]|jgi:hypothetical protein|nr:hypothetical protein [Propionibacteriaceae bacterium]
MKAGSVAVGALSAILAALVTLAGPPDDTGYLKQVGLEAEIKAGVRVRITDTQIAHSVSSHTGGQVRDGWGQCYLVVSYEVVSHAAGGGFDWTLISGEKSYRTTDMPFAKGIGFTARSMAPFLIPCDRIAGARLRTESIGSLYSYHWITEFDLGLTPERVAGMEIQDMIALAAEEQEGIA